MKFLNFISIISDFCQNAKPFNITYSDTGLFGMYFVCDGDHCMTAAENVLDAWHRISYSVTDAELDEAKNRLIKHLLTKLNSMHQFIVFIQLLQSYLYFSSHKKKQCRHTR